MRGERDIAWLAKATKVLSTKYSTSTDSQGARKKTLVRKKRTEKRHARKAV